MKKKAYSLPPSLLLGGMGAARGAIDPVQGEGRTLSALVEGAGAGTGATVAGLAGSAIHPLLGTAGLIGGGAAGSHLARKLLAMSHPRPEALPKQASLNPEAFYTGYTHKGK
jgi:hypothetical protein